MIRSNLLKDRKPVGLGTEMERAGREEKELEGECAMGLLLLRLLENEGLRNLADNSSRESDLYEKFSEIDEKSGAI